MPVGTAVGNNVWWLQSPADVSCIAALSSIVVVNPMRQDIDSMSHPQKKETPLATTAPSQSFEQRVSRHGSVVGTPDGTVDGRSVGLGVGLVVGCQDGPGVGFRLGEVDGTPVGHRLGKFVGKDVGSLVGPIVGT